MLKLTMYAIIIIILIIIDIIIINKLVSKNSFILRQILYTPLWIPQGILTILNMENKISTDSRWLLILILISLYTLILTFLNIKKHNFGKEV
ncbi:MAG: hypothetical protein A2Y23_07295 [Clostridiales bacterium GWB2_37_7]|nr:MAG: hypothetical protein A2Y23_07295 [Clostridiales bacterium GWB2_37_7]